MRKTLSVLALALLASHAVADDTKSAIGGGVGGALGNVVGGAWVAPPARPSVLA